MSAIFYKNLPYGAGGSNVEANPSGSATDDLTKVGIDGTVYDVTDADAVHSSDKGVANGVASLDATGRVPSTQLPSYVDDVLEYASLSAFPATGESGKIYIALDTNKTYRWSGSAYVEISESLALGTTHSTAAYGDDAVSTAEPSFSEAGTRANLAGSGEKLSVILGKIKKWFTDLKDLAFIGKDGNNSKKYLRGDGTWQSMFEGSVVGDIQIKDNDSGFTTTIYAVNDSLTGLNLLNVPDKSGTIATTNDIPDVETAKTATGNPITLTDASESYAEELKVTLEPIQSGSGTPSPSNIRPITGYTEVNVGTGDGINVWDETWEEGIISHVDGTNSAAANRIRSKNYIPCEPNTQYYFCTTGNLGLLRVCYYDRNKTFVSAINNQDWNNIYTTPNNVYYMRWCQISADVSTYENNVSINYPATETSYHPYQSTTATLSFGQEVFGCDVDMLTGEVVVDRAVKTITGSESGATITWNSYSFKVNDGIDSNSEISVYESSYSDDALTGSEMYSSRASGHDYGYCVGSGQIMRIRNRNLTQDLASYQTWFQNNTIQVCYKLATPITLQLTPSELKLLKEQNTITTNGTTISLKYQPDNVIGEAIGVSEEYTDRHFKWKKVGEYYNGDLVTIDGEWSEILLTTKNVMTTTYMFSQVFPFDLFGTATLTAFDSGGSYSLVSNTKYVTIENIIGPLCVYVR